MKLIITRAPLSPVTLNIEKISENTFGLHRPVAFVLPGGPGISHKNYLSYSALKDTVDILFHDPRGCGDSDRGDLATYTMNNYIDDVESIREQLGLKKIIVIGKSYGSICALGYAIRYPQSVSQLILSAGAPSYHFLETAKATIKRIGTPVQIAVCEKLWTGTFTSTEELLMYFQLTNSLYSVKSVRQNSLEDFTKKASQFSYEVLNEGFKNHFWYYNFEPQLSHITCPTLILAGRKDWINDVQYAELMAKRIANSTLKIFDDAGHAMEIDAGNIYFDCIREFIQRHQSA